MQLSILASQFELRFWQTLVPLMRRWRLLQSAIRTAFWGGRALRALFADAPLSSRFVPFTLAAMVTAYWLGFLLGK